MTVCALLPLTRVPEISVRGMGNATLTPPREDAHLPIPLRNPTLGKNRPMKHDLSIKTSAIPCRFEVRRFVTSLRVAYVFMNTLNSECRKYQPHRLRPFDLFGTTVLAKKINT